MPKTRIIKYALIIFLLLPLITFAETQEIKEYKVIKEIPFGIFLRRN